MSTNKQRREAAKLKLKRQVERQTKTNKRNKLFFSLVGLFVCVIALIGISFAGFKWYQSITFISASSCQYDPTSAQIPNPKPESPPSGLVRLKGTKNFNFNTSQGDLSGTITRNGAPCAAESVISLLNRGFYNNTICHREAQAPNFGILQCGDPTATGAGGPGYSVKAEDPKGLKASSAGPGAVIYPRGTIAMAKGQTVSGSQIFFVNKDTTLQASYPIIGKLDAKGLETLDKIVKNGIIAPPGQPSNPAQGVDGKPKIEVKIITANTK